MQGMLGIACSLKGCPHVLGIDIDDDALQQAAQNIEEFEELPMQLLAADVCSCLPFHRLPVADLVICNPPFGSWRKGADTEFLAAAAQVRSCRRSPLQQPPSTPGEGLVLIPVNVTHDWHPTCLLTWLRYPAACISMLDASSC